MKRNYVLKATLVTPDEAKAMLNAARRFTAVIEHESKKMQAAVERFTRSLAGSTEAREEER